LVPFVSFSKKMAKNKCHSKLWILICFINLMHSNLFTSHRALRPLYCYRMLDIINVYIDLKSTNTASTTLNLVGSDLECMPNQLCWNCRGREGNTDIAAGNNFTENLVDRLNKRLALDKGISTYFLLVSYGAPVHVMFLCDWPVTCPADCTARTEDIQEVVSILHNN
jgi:hypothetical protein